MITRIHFIVNPVAGSGRNKLSPELMNKVFGNDIYDIKIKESEFAGHAIELAKESIKEKAEVIVACGGDGTINEVAGCLVGTNVILGIVPMGSGNGLASNLKIPRDTVKALRIIKNFKVIKIDTGSINNEYFFSNTGIGFDAHVISDFEDNKKRKLWGYIKAVIKALKTYNYSNCVEISYLNEQKKVYPFLLFVSNSNEMGYKMSLTPKASLQDGVLDVIIVPKLSSIKMVFFTILFFIKKHYWLKEVEFIKTNSLIVRKSNDHIFKAQKDGERLKIEKDTIKIELLPKALNVCVT
ncbi:diacylglycerol/lipid kinase family protein [Ulvibacter antarcticus]|uniref:YegS/Rv2252/BmrU family lipid kinase n=1 Tax=Ulvibacter antarcticus TaxID=442714 RepID=A0A3L9YJ12_9FLAO|nr:diacylglycerol kinase family protein [Ulvibacter antarcticus]RMA57928.1 YegS/Rv2252/BmrU family lipid kinase [Ulvibacter antarcticus]